MSYLIIDVFFEEQNLAIVQELTSILKKNCESGYIAIVDLERNEFYVENDTWQKILEK